MKMLNLFNTLLEFKKSKTKIVLILHFFSKSIFGNFRIAFVLTIQLNKLLENKKKEFEFI